MKTLDWSVKLPVVAECDLLVCGGGPAGFAAALSARRVGTDVLLIEGQGQLGGMGTSGLVSHWLGGRQQDGNWVVGGIFRELCTDASAHGIALIPRDDRTDPYTPHGWYKSLIHGVPFDPFGMARFLDEKAADADLRVLLHTRAVAARTNNNSVTGVVIHNKSGLAAITCKTVIDATGDADVAVFAGAPHVSGREEDGAMAPVTLVVHVDSVDQAALSDYIHAHRSPRFRELIQGLRAQGQWPFDTDIFISVQLTEPGTMMLNTTRLCGFDGTDGWSVSKGMQEGRREIQTLLTTLRENWPGFSRARVKAVAPVLGVRESRRIQGEYRLTVSDVQTGRFFADTVGYSAYGWDLPDPARPSHQPMHGAAKPPVTAIPYRTMVPRSVDNVLCPGRAVSVERDVLGPVRVMAPCMAMGEAAGLAASQVIRTGCAFAEVDVADLKKALSHQGAIVDWQP